MRGRIAATGFLLAVVAALAAMLAGLGARWGWWEFGTGFQVLRFAVYGAIGGAAVSMLALLSALRAQEEYPLLLPPLPNTQFTRDSSAWVFQGVTLNPMYWPVRVSTLMTSPSLMKSGTWMVIPLSSRAGF